MRHNSTNVAGAGVDHTNVVDEMNAYDQLDERVKRFLQRAPEKLSARWALQAQERLGVDALLESGRRMLAQRYPGFKL